MKLQQFAIHLLVAITFGVLSLVAPTSTFAANRATPASLQEVISSNLQFIAAEQVGVMNPLYQNGEWPTTILSTLVPVAVGVGQMTRGGNDEASAFTTGSVANQLATLYLEHPELRNDANFARIPDMVSDAVRTFERYRENHLFNFYPPKMIGSLRVHQPAAMKLWPIWKGFTNIPEDADTSSVVYATLMYNARLHGGRFAIPNDVLASFATFRDINRTSYYYNYIEGRKNTGAFMTWQMDEKDAKMPHYYFARPERGTRIPFNKNDVDCVVNANVLRMLALNRTEGLLGQQASCAMINDMIVQQEHATCAIYYPNTYNLVYSMAEARKAGDTCIEAQNKKRIVDYIIERQIADGGWNNDQNIWNDRIQSTAFAMQALIEFGDRNDRKVESTLRYGTAFLLRQMSTSQGGHLYWKGEIFFTATAIARSLVNWRSNSFTTATVTKVLADMAKYYPQYDLHYYQTLN